MYSSQNERNFTLTTYYSGSTSVFLKLDSLHRFNFYKPGIPLAHFIDVTKVYRATS